MPSAHLAGPATGEKLRKEKTMEDLVFSLKVVRCTPQWAARPINMCDVRWIYVETSIAA